MRRCKKTKHPHIKLNIFSRFFSRTFSNFFIISKVFPLKLKQVHIHSRWEKIDSLIRVIFCTSFQRQINEVCVFDPLRKILSWTTLSVVLSSQDFGCSSNGFKSTISVYKIADILLYLFIHPAGERHWGIKNLSQEHNPLSPLPRLEPGPLDL